MSRPLRVLHVVPTFYPAAYWGGPIYSVYGLCNALAQRPEVELRVLTTDSAGPRLHERLATSGEVMLPAGYTVYYARRQFGVSGSLDLLGQLWPMIRWADVVHITGVYSFPTIPALLGCRLFHKSIVWSPRGALQRWQGTRKRGVKRLWEWACRSVMANRNSVLHVTSDMEARESLDRVRGARASVIANGVEIPDAVPARAWQPGGQLRLLYIGRLDVKKGIENLIDALAELETSVVLDICGVGPEPYMQALKERVQRSGVGARVRFHGHVDAKSSVFWNADVCVVPSYTENFAMVVAEALAHGVSVIASTGTPWQALGEHDCGMWVANDPKTLASAIRDMRRRDLEALGARGRKWMQREFGWESVAQRMRALYCELVDAAR